MSIFNNSLFYSTLANLDQILCIKFRKFYLTIQFDVAIMCIDYSKNIKGGGSMFNKNHLVIRPNGMIMSANRIYCLPPCLGRSLT